VSNGSHKEGPAYADRLREKYAKHNRLTQKALDDARNPVSQTPGSQPYRAEYDSVSEVTVGREGVKIKARSPWVTVILAAFAALVAVAWILRH
jgi:hypothetical protein